MQQLRDLAVLVTLRMGAYGAVVQDRAETERLNAAHGATTRAHKVSRDKLAGTSCGEILERIRKAQAETRGIFNARTLPWDDRGRRMCGNSAAAELFSILSKQRGRIDSLVGEFCAAWPDAERQARAALNGGWKPEYADDYRIPVEAIREQFQFAPGMESMPSAEDIRIEAPEQMIRAAREEAERQMQERFREGCRDAHARMVEALQHLYDRLRDPEATYRDSLFGNLRELLDLLPALNIAKDPELTRIGNEARRRLLAFDLPAIPGMEAPEPTVAALAQRARDDTRHRAKVAASAGAILADLKAYMGQR